MVVNAERDAVAGGVAVRVVTGELLVEPLGQDGRELLQAVHRLTRQGLLAHRCEQSGHRVVVAVVELGVAEDGSPPHGGGVTGGLGVLERLLVGGHGMPFSSSSWRAASRYCELVFS